MFWNIFIAEQSKIFRRKILWIEMGLLSALLIVMSVALYSQKELAGIENLTWPKGLQDALQTVGSPNFGGLLVVILVAAVVAQEYSWRSIHLWLSNGTPRPMLIVAKFVATVLPVLMIVFTAVVVGSVMTSVFTYQVNGSIDLSQINFAEDGLAALRTAFVLLPYAALAFLFAIIGRSPIVSIGGAMGYAMVESLAVQFGSQAGGIIAKVVECLPGGLTTSVLGQNQAAINMASQAQSDSGMTIGAIAQRLDPTLAGVGVGLYVIVLVGLAMWAFRRQDLAA